MSANLKNDCFYFLICRNGLGCSGAKHLTMENNYFFEHWDYRLNPSFIEKICDVLQNAPTVGSFSTGAYCQGIRKFDNEENGLYFFYFPDETYYAGVAASCTLLERLSKHLDGRSCGSSNGLLKKLGQNLAKSTYYAANQQFFLEAKMLFVPVSNSKLTLQGKEFPKDKKALNFLEEDIIYMMFQKELKLKNSKIPKKYSGYFYKD